MSQNLYDLPDPLPPDELFTDLIPDAGVKIERIVSSGQATPEGEWYDQPRDEWVALIQGEATIAYEDGSEVTLQAGDHLLIPAHIRHRVAITSESPPCIWIAVHGRLT
ncbi:MAG: cupin domain-containing protein [Chloroflexota bacterium]|nr:cupin domain-containing protein [Chloroflexota bacterium]